jgi:site-specific DNA recombinase
MLTNVVYTGKVAYGGEVYEGEHERIVDDETWNRVQSVLSRNGRRGGRNVGNKHGALLKGLVRCASCDAGMVHSYVSKKNRFYRYYVCVKAHQRGWAQCETRSVSAPALENAVVEQLHGIARNPAMLREVLRQIEEHRLQDAASIDKEKAAIEVELKKIAQATGDTASMAGGLRVAASDFVQLQDRMNHLGGRLADIQRQMAGIEAERANPKDVEAALREFEPLWEQLSTWEQERFIRTLVEQVRYDGKTGTVTVGFRSTGIRDLCNRASANREEN